MSVTLALVLGTLTFVVWLIHSVNKRNASYWPKLGVPYINYGSFLKSLIKGDLDGLTIYKELKETKAPFAGVMEVLLSIIE